MTPLISDACVDVEGGHFELEHHLEAYKLLMKIILCGHFNAFMKNIQCSRKKRLFLMLYDGVLTHHALRSVTFWYFEVQN